MEIISKLSSAVSQTINMCLVLRYWLMVINKQNKELVMSASKYVALAALATAFVSQIASAQLVGYELSDRSFTASLIIHRETPGGFARNDDGTFLIVNGKKVPAYGNSWETGTPAGGTTTFNSESNYKIAQYRIGTR